MSTAINRFDTAPIMCPRHVYSSSTNKYDTSTADETELSRIGLKLGKIPGIDPDCQTSGGTACTVTNNNELHYMIATGHTGMTDSTKKNILAKSI